MMQRDEAFKQQFNVYLPPDLVKKIKHAAIEGDYSLSSLVEQIFREYLAAARGGSRMDTRMVVYSYVSDLDRLRQFYEAALGAKADLKGRHWLTFDFGGSTFALHGLRSTEPPHDVGQFHFEFQVDDIETALARFEALGATVERGVTDEVYGKSAVLLDPDGRRFRLMQEQPPV